MTASDSKEQHAIEQMTEEQNESEPKSHASILVEQFLHAKETFGRSVGSQFTSAFTAGIEIGISYVMLLFVFATLSPMIETQYAILFASLLYPLGFIAVVIGQSLLFTEQTSLLSLPVVRGMEPISHLLKLWAIVILGNLIGGCFFVLSIVWLGLEMQWFTAQHMTEFAHHVLDHSWWVILGSAIVAGWLMGVAAWLVTSARDTLSRILLVTLITACIGVLGLHHSIVGNIEVFAALVFGDGVQWLDYLRFLLLALVGNTIGGVVFVTVLKNQTFEFDLDKVKNDPHTRSDIDTHRRSS